MMSDDLSAVKRGDMVMYVPVSGKPHQCEVTVAGPKWLAVEDRGRFSRESGRTPGGRMDPHIETVAGHVERAERERLAGVMRPWGWIPATGRRPMTTEQMRRAAALLKRFEAET